MTRGGQPYRFVSANFWGAAYVAAQDLPRFRRELDLLAAQGVKNLRVMFAFEGPDGEPWRVSPALRPTVRSYDPVLEKGMDHVLFEAAKRGMTVVATLGNFWPWSGGFGQLRVWAKAGQNIPYPPPAVGGSWDTYQRFVARMYSEPAAKQLYMEGVKRWVMRVSTLNGKPYREDPTILSWQLANEPRGFENVDAFNQWIVESARAIKNFDSRHLVSVGTEGETLQPEAAGLDVLRNHSAPEVDYVTAHLWPQNWGIYDPSKHTESFARTLEVAKQYIIRHAQLSEQLEKPLVLEEFGLARDEGSFQPEAPVAARDALFDVIFKESFRQASVAGVGFWSWSGEGRPREPGGYWRKGDPIVGDPAHEPQGWYGVYSKDASTLALLKRAARLAEPTPLKNSVSQN